MNKNKLFKIGFLTGILICICILASLTNVKASSTEAKYQYLTKKYVGEEIYVNVSDEIVPFLYDIGIDVKDKPETSGWWLWKKTTHHYYYITNEYINYKIISRNLTNDIDSIIYMVKQLEYYADDFRTQNIDCEITSSELVLNYIRTINKNYTTNSDEYGMANYAFDFVCGSLYRGLFRDFVNEAEYSKFGDYSSDSLLTIPGLFASFLSKSEINELYMNKESNTIPTTDNKLILFDPLGSGQKIDLLHLFCTIDGCNYYDRSINELKRECGDMISWAGDLQTASTKINISNIKNFRSILNGDYSFDWSDFLADIDGYNIGYNLLKPKYNNLLSVALSGYYGKSESGTLLMTGKARYKLFINSIGVVNTNSIDNGMSEFKTRIGYAMNIDTYDFEMEEFKPPLPYRAIYKVYGMPSLETRVQLANLFFDFVCIQAEYDNRGVKGKKHEKENTDDNISTKCIDIIKL